MATNESDAEVMRRASARALLAQKQADKLARQTPANTASNRVSAHVAAADPHPQYLERHLPEAITPAAIRDLAIEATSDTTLTLKMRGSDGVVRTFTLEAD